MTNILRRKTRPVNVGGLLIGGGNPIAVQSMCATKTQDIEATLRQIQLLKDAGADLIRVAVDSRKDVEALAEIRKSTDARLAVDLQESYRLAEKVAPYVQKIRYNPGHLHHHEKNVPVVDKVRYLVGVAKEHNCAIRIGVNFGSLDPSRKSQSEDPTEIALASVDEHIGYMNELGFTNFVVSLKSSDPFSVIAINRAFSDRHPEVPIHLGVTESGMLPMGEVKTRTAFEPLLADGIGDTMRVSLTLPFEQKHLEIRVAKHIIDDVYSGKFGTKGSFDATGLNIISCPSCSRVENEAFVELAEEVREMSKFAAKENITIAVMGCRVNGPGETDDADLGVWCAPNHVNLKRKGEFIGTFSYEDILPKLKAELETLILHSKAA